MRAPKCPRSSGAHTIRWPFGGLVEEINIINILGQFLYEIIRKRAKYIIWGLPFHIFKQDSAAS